MLVSNFDSGGFRVAFVFSVCLSAVFAVLYRRETGAKRRPYYLFPFRAGIAGALFLTLLTGLRRFVLRQSSRNPERAGSATVDGAGECP